MKTLKIFFTMLLSATFFFASAFTAAPDVTCPVPQNVRKVAETSNSISFDWDDCGLCSSQSFKVFYVKNGNTSAVYSTSNSDFTFTNLTAGEYEFHFMTDCGGELSAEIIIVDDVIEV